MGVEQVEDMVSIKHLLVVIGEHIANFWNWLRANDEHTMLGTTTPDATQITARLWTGGAIEVTEQLVALLASGVTADIDCQEERDDAPLIAAINGKVAYIWNPQADDGQPKPVSWFQTSYAFARPVYDAGGVILAHCGAGVNRGPSTCYFLMRALEGYTSTDALALLKQKRPQVEARYAADADRAIVALGLGS